MLSARVAAVAGDAGLRSRVLRSVELLERESGEIPLFGAFIAHTRGILERDVTVLAEAAAALRGIRPLLSACAAEDCGTELARTGSNAAAVDQFNAAFDGFVESEATVDARRVARTLRSLGVERRITNQARDKCGWSSLTNAELKVVNLLADGATNAVVAEHLHISPHTVKSHVRSAFAKLGVNSRSQLAALRHTNDSRH
jgi:DNA-binding CsgD family transcriptional regulator